MGQLQLLDFHLFHALTLAASWSGLGAEEQRKALEGLEQEHRKLSEWARFSPTTFRAPERMVAAELARIAGRNDDAIQAYEEALQAAREHDFIQYVALASELAARYWRERRVPTIAGTYARTATEAYRRWGAEGKARHLSAQWPHLATAPVSSEGTVTDTSSTQIDALAVVKAQQAISGEIVLEKLAATLLRVAIENAGAQRGALLLPRGGKLSVAAASGVSADGVDPRLLRQAHARACAHRGRGAAARILRGSVVLARRSPLRALPAAAAPGGAPRRALPGEQPRHQRVHPLAPVAARAPGLPGGDLARERPALLGGSARRVHPAPGQ
jgi:hypothetical protein